MLGEHRDRGELIKTFALDNNRVDHDQRTAEGKLSVMDKERSSLVDSVMSAASRVKVGFCFKKILLMVCG